MNFKLGELFSGAGGLALGAKLVANGSTKIEHTWAVDYDKDACDT
jgi:DNA (cytosine-5)-methyltransferase 1